MLVKDEKHKTVKGYISFSQLVSFTFGDEGASVLHEVPETLGEARGQVILFHEDWPDNDCELGTALCYYFLLRAKKHLDKAAGNSSPILTYMSGYMNRLFGLIPDTYGMANHLLSMLGPFVRDHRLCRMSDRGWLDQVQRPWKTSEQ